MDGGLSDDELAAVEAELPRTAQLQESMTAFPPDLVATRFPPYSSVPTAIVCLIDAERMLAEARYALGRAIAQERYGESGGSPWLASFYAMDVALRMYAAGEHLANAIVAMLEITEPHLKPFKKGVQSRQCVVGKYLSTELAEHPITKATAGLHGAAEWAQARGYRDAWVHNQGPLLEGIGVVWKRGLRWNEVRKGVHQIGIGNGDRPDTTATELIAVMRGAVVAFVAACENVVGWYHERLAEHSVSRNPEDGTVTVGI